MAVSRLLDAVADKDSLLLFLIPCRVVALGAVIAAHVDEPVEHVVAARRRHLLRRQLLQLRAYLASGFTTVLDPAIGVETAERLRGAMADGAPGPELFVLAPFLPEEQEVLGRVLARAADCTQAWLDGESLQSLMGTFNN